MNEDCNRNEKYESIDDQSDSKRDVLSNFEMEVLKKELQFELNELENEFKMTKDLLFKERCHQVDIKLQQSKNGTASEFIEVAALVEEAHKLRKEIAKSRRDFALEVANKQLDLESQTATCDAKEDLRSYEESIRNKLKDRLCKLLSEEYSNKKRKKKPPVSGSKGANANEKASRSHPRHQDSSEEDERESLVVSLLSDSELEDFDHIKLPLGDLQSRSSPVAISPDQPHMVYHLAEDDISCDLEAIFHAIKEQKIQSVIANKYPLLG